MRHNYTFVYKQDDSLSHAVGVKATSYLPLQSDVMSPKASYNPNDDCIHIKWMLNGRWGEDTRVTTYARSNSGGYTFDGNGSLGIDYCKEIIKRQGNLECSNKGMRATWDDARLTAMAKNFNNQANSAMASISEKLNRDPRRH